MDDPQEVRRPWLDKAELVVILTVLLILAAFLILTS